MDFYLYLPAIAFWFSFAFTPGPFWMAWMNYHTQENSLSIYKQYLIYLFLFFAPFNFLMAYLILQANDALSFSLIPLYFIGASFIIYLAIKSFYLQVKKAKISFTFWNMVIITCTSPKIYLTVPAGVLSMMKLDELSVITKSLIFAVVVPPILLAGSVFFLALAKMGNRLMMNKVRYVTSSLLLGYGLFLLYEGIILL